MSDGNVNGTAPPGGRTRPCLTCQLIRQLRSASAKGPPRKAARRLSRDGRRRLRRAGKEVESLGSAAEPERQPDYAEDAYPQGRPQVAIFGDFKKLRAGPCSSVPGSRLRRRSIRAQ